MTANLGVQIGKKHPEKNNLPNSQKIKDQLPRKSPTLEHLTTGLPVSFLSLCLRKTAVFFLTNLGSGTVAELEDGVTKDGTIISIIYDKEVS